MVAQLDAQLATSFFRWGLVLSIIGLGSSQVLLGLLMFVQLSGFWEGYHARTRDTMLIKSRVRFSPFFRPTSRSILQRFILPQFSRCFVGMMREGIRIFYNSIL